MRKRNVGAIHNDGYMDVRQIAAYLQVGVSMVRELVDAGERTRGEAGFFPIYRLGPKTIRVKKSDVDAYMERTVCTSR